MIIDFRGRIFNNEVVTEIEDGLKVHEEVALKKIYLKSIIHSIFSSSNTKRIFFSFAKFFELKIIFLDSPFFLIL